MKKTQGFTVIEIIIVIAFLATASVVLFTQRESLAATHRDDQRKISINAMYYNLEEVYFKKNGFYPVSINAEALPAMDPALFTDPTGIALGEAQSNYRYTASDCEGDQCKQYSLRSSMEKEADFVKANRKND